MIRLLLVPACREPLPQIRQPGCSLSSPAGAQYLPHAPAASTRRDGKPTQPFRQRRFRIPSQPNAGTDGDKPTVSERIEAADDHGATTVPVPCRPRPASPRRSCPVRAAGLALRPPRRNDSATQEVTCSLSAVGGSVPSARAARDCRPGRRRNRSGRTVHMRTDADADRPSRTVDGVVPTFVQPARSHRSGHWFDPRRVSDNAVGAGEGYGVAALGHTEFAVDRSDV